MYFSIEICSFKDSLEAYICTASGWKQAGEKRQCRTNESSSARLRSKTQQSLVPQLCGIVRKSE